MTTNIDELKDGKLPPTIWCAPGRWYPNSSYDPQAVRHIEVTAARNASIQFITASKSGKKPYRQFFLRLPE